MTILPQKPKGVSAESHLTTKKSYSTRTIIHFYAHKNVKKYTFMRVKVYGELYYRKLTVLIGGK